jgi:hypothetical protein
LRRFGDSVSPNPPSLFLSKNLLILASAKISKA